MSGIASGFLNVVGGGGSLITLPLLTLLGMDLGVANGTNRIAILMQNITAVRSFYKDKVLPVKLSLLCAIPATIGSIVGTYVVVSMPQTLLKKIVGALLLVMAFFIVAKPSMWSGQKKERLNVPLIVLAFFGIGFYGGFIQAGVGFFFVFFTAVLLGLDLVRNNALKVLIILLYTPFSLMIFLLNGKVQPLAGIVLGVGSMIGAQLGAKFAVKKGVNWLRYILLATVVASGVSYLI
ncbi:sulfite exporter TauE/SafE family protein [Pseudothermotoga sp.]